VDDVDSVVALDNTESKPKPKKGKKRPSDFEIVRTILTRTHERKLQWLLKDMGEHEDILFLCSRNEEEFTYGSPEISIAIFEFTDPDLHAMVFDCLGMMHGIKDAPKRQRTINLRDQISELSKTKGVSLDVEVESNEAGSVWVTKTDIAGKDRTTYFSLAIDSLFHMQTVKHWCDLYRPLLATEDPSHLYYDYTHSDTNTGRILTLPANADKDHPLAKMYPYGFRTMVTRGLDVVVNKFLLDIPFPILKEEIVVFQNESASCQIAHRIISEGWRMILVRPNAVLFPSLGTTLPVVGHHSL
jgi:hypothetical protein